MPIFTDWAWLEALVGPVDEDFVQAVKEQPKEQEREARLAVLDASITRGLADARAGRVKSATDVFNRLESKYSASTPRLD